MSTVAEKGGATFQGIKMLLCENPLPPIAEAIAAAQAEVPHSNYYTEPYSTPLRQLIAARLGVPERLIHINAGSELILRQNFQRLGRPLSRSVPAPAGRFSGRPGTIKAAPDFFLKHLRDTCRGEDKDVHLMYINDKHSQ